MLGVAEGNSTHFINSDCDLPYILAMSTRSSSVLLIPSTEPKRRMKNEPNATIANRAPSIPKTIMKRGIQAIIGIGANRRKVGIKNLSNCFDKPIAKPMMIPETQPKEKPTANLLTLTSVCNQRSPFLIKATNADITEDGGAMSDAGNQDSLKESSQRRTMAIGKNKPWSCLD